MSHYVVGDIQGCYSEFRQLLDAIAFEPARDRLWLVGDLVNRGPDSLSVLRTVKSLGAAGTMEFAEKRGPAHAPRGFAPWFEHPTRKSAGTTIFCGHWSTLDLMIAPNVLMLDSGCVWGGPLTAVRLDDGRVFQMPSRAEIA